ncbi:MAG: carbon-nitrogen hydrolase family protein [Thermoguttaceae bacterium]
MSRHRTERADRLSRRQVIKAAATTVATGVAALASQPGGEAAGAAALPPQTSAAGQQPPPRESADKLRIATCQFPVGASPLENARYIRDFMSKAAEQGAHLLHTSEACLSGYAGTDFRSFEGFDWDSLRKETTGLRSLAKDLKLWLVLGSAHFLDEHTRPTNCLYLVDPDGRIADRYDKCFCTGGDQKHYSAGDRLVTRDIRGVRIGLAICYDICWPQLYIGYRQLGVTVMIHSFYNAGAKGKNCLDTLNVYQVPTRCADNRLWAVANNSSRPYSHWGSFIARPDATIAQRLEINQPGMLVHDFPDTLSEGGWYHNQKPMLKRDDEIMTWGTPSNHPRQRDGQSEP